MKNKLRNGLLIIFCVTMASSLLSSCNKSKYPGYDETESGLAYKFHKKGDGKEKPKEGDIMYMTMKFKNSKDSVIFDSKSQGQPIMIPLQKSSFKGSIEEGFAMMSVGDSASFIVNADSLYAKIFKMDLPKFVEKNSGITFELKLEKMTAKAEFEKEQQALQAKRMEEMQALQNAEASERAKYLTDNKITTKPTESGLIYIETKKGNGPRAKAGNTVSVKYSGSLLNGKVFDASDNHPDKAPFEFKLGQGSVIPGWDEGISMMQAGTKAKFIIPSSIGYGERAMGDAIPPFSTLLFDVELVSIK